jgi:serine/threonine protein kinase
MDSNGTGSGNCLPPNALLGEYRLLGVIGEGGFGIVYRANDLSLDREVAIKEYLPATMASRTGTTNVHVRSQHRGAFDAGLRSFINEARLLAKFSHPALVQVYRFFEGNGTAYMVMRCYQGQTLRAFLENPTHVVDERWLKAILSPLLDVLEMLHAADCYHRDIAPDNVFLQNSGSPVMLDFGAARRIISDMTQALTMVLKPGFAPIEQYAEDGSMPQGAWTDIYQLGALLYQVITGKPPTTSVARMINDPIKPLSPEQYPAYSAEFLDGVHKALAVKPQDRPQSIPELKELLGITDFSSSAFARFSSDVESRDFSPSEHAQLFRETERDPLYPVTTPGTTRPPQIVTSSPATQPAADASSSAGPSPAKVEEPASDALLALFDKAPAATEKTEEPEAQAVVQENVLAAESGPKDATTNRQNNKAGSDTRKKTWVVAALAAGLVMSTAVYQLLSPESATGLNKEAALWSATKAYPNAAAFREYLAAFPDGPHRAEAQARLKSLETPLPSPPVETRTQATNTEQIATPITGTQTSAHQQQPTIAPPEQDRPNPPDSRPPTTQNSPMPPSSVTAAATMPAEPVVRGKVIFRVTPWGRIYVDRAGIGMTPPRMELDLPVGPHRVSVTNPAAPPMVWNIQVKKDEPVVLTHHFEPKPAGDPPASPPSETK